jgi:uncharacterized protein YhaN
MAISAYRELDKLRQENLELKAQVADLERSLDAYFYVTTGIGADCRRRRNRPACGAHLCFNLQERAINSPTTITVAPFTRVL